LPGSPDRWPEIDLDQRYTRWTEIETGIALVVDDDVMFAPVGGDVHVVGSIPGGELVCLVLRSDGRIELGAVRDNPFSAESAKLN
jgi:hypothetical protein